MRDWGASEQKAAKGTGMAERVVSLMARLIRGLGSLAVLLLGTAGVPVALALLGGNPLPEALTWSAARHALFTPADGMILVGLITIVGWLAWLVFTLSVISELVAVMSRQRIRFRLPGLDAPQRFAAGLLISVITMISVPHAVQADPHSDRQVAAAASSAGATGIDHRAGRACYAHCPAAPRAERVDDMRRHVVEAGDDLWSLAERYYGDGREWRKIAAANPKVLTGGPDRLQVGWRLKIPDLDEGVASGGDRVVTVRRGDTLSSIAERELGAAARWTDIFHANRAQLSDPDELPVGMRLLVPQPKKSAGKARPKAHDQHRPTEATPSERQRPTSPSEPSSPASQPAGSPTRQPDESSPTAATRTTPAVDIAAVSLAGVGGAAGGRDDRRTGLAAAHPAPNQTARPTHCASTTADSHCRGRSRAPPAAVEPADARPRDACDRRALQGLRYRTTATPAGLAR